ncbi:MAG: acetyl-CoA carboxylase carboxyl transferase subunit alpha, partial [Candidatus Marinimicrobia bacterium]|nr:acetyl-CoA carboxylase carboxyl transferase subunit alpha [Candidatus Neomarinimicrobiota bacterium]
DATQKKKAAEAMKITAEDLLQMGLADRIIAEPLGGAHRNHKETASILKSVIKEELHDLSATPVKELLEHRATKTESMGVWED